MFRVFILIFLFLQTIAATSFGQGCSVCTQTANQLGDKGADGLNNGIIYLALLPLTFIFGLGYLWWRHQKKSA